MYYTSYFAKMKMLNGKYTLASITAKKPKFCNSSVLDWSFLGPSSSLLNAYKAGEVSEEEYTRIYIDDLSKMWSKISDFIIENKDKNIVMLCYEGPGKFCHRHLLSNFLRCHGIDCCEMELGR